MENITYRKNPDTNAIEKVIVTTTESVETIDVFGLESQIQNLKEQIGGFEQAKVAAQADADARKADMDGRIASYNQQIADLETKKASVYAAFPDLDSILENVNQQITQN